MSEEVRASVRRSRALPVVESRVLPVGRFLDTAAPTSAEASTGGSLWVDLRHGCRIDAGRVWLGYLARFTAYAAGVSWATLLIERLSRPGSTSSRYCRMGTPSRRQLSTIEKMAATFGPAFSLPIWLHIGSKEAGPKIAAIFSVIESCRKLNIPTRKYLADVLPGLAERSIQALAVLTPTAYAANRAK